MQKKKAGPNLVQSLVQRRAADFDFDLARRAIMLNCNTNLNTRCTF